MGSPPQLGLSYAVALFTCPTGDQGTPALRTMQRWCGMFEEHEPEWLTEADQAASLFTGWIFVYQVS